MFSFCRIKKETTIKKEEKYIYYNTNIKEYIRELDTRVRLEAPREMIILEKEDWIEISQEVIALTKEGISHHYEEDWIIQLHYNSWLIGKMFYIVAKNDVKYEEIFDEHFQLKEYNWFYTITIPVSEEKVKTYLISRVYYYSWDTFLLEGKVKKEIKDYFNSISLNKIEELRKERQEKSRAIKNYLLTNLKNKTPVSKSFLKTFRDALTLEEIKNKIDDYNNKIKEIRNE